jgi:hypothetical protein
MQLIQRLEEIKHSNQGANSRWLYTIWTGVEVLFGVWILGGAISLISQGTEQNRFLFWIGCMCILFALILFGNAARVVTNRFMNRKISLLYEAVLQGQEAH